MEKEPGLPNRKIDEVLGVRAVIASRLFLYACLALLASGAIWASVTPIDEVVRAPGQVEVNGQPIRIVPPRSARVQSLPVRIGDAVRKGDVLLELDASEEASEAEQLGLQIAGLDSEVARCRDGARAMREQAQYLKEELRWLKEARTVLVEGIRSLKKLAEENIGAPAELRAKELELAQAEAPIVRLEAALRQNETGASEREHLASEAQCRAESLKLKRARVEELRRRMTLTSPVDGTVTHLSVSHPGGVVEAGNAAVVVAPKDEPWIVLLQVSNGSIRRLRPGMKVLVRTASMLAKDAKRLEGAIFRIAPDADPEGNYRVWVSLDTPASPLRSGLHLTGEIVVGRRTLMDLALDPLRGGGGSVALSD